MAALWVKTRYSKGKTWPIVASSTTCPFNDKKESLIKETKNINNDGDQKNPYTIQAV